MPLTSLITAPSFPFDQYNIVLNGKYKVTGSIDKGSQGHVFRAHDMMSNDDVVIKVCPSNGKSEAEARFFARGLAHKNLVVARGQFEENDKKHFVLEYVRTNLYNALMANVFLPHSELRVVMRGVLQGLLEMHKNGYAHRDIKPKNILLSSENIDDQCEVKLTDFGLVHDTKQEPLADDRCGSQGYFAPEVITPFYYNAMATDVWSAGVMMFHMYTSFHPWDCCSSPDKPDPLFDCYCKQRATYWEWAEHYSEQAVSDDFRELFEGMCAVEADDRLTVAQCLRHPFLAKNPLSRLGLRLSRALSPTG